jgi:glycosyltransferase involved in cell wall biosynthesis
MHYPKISVITPSFNCKALIADTMHSVLDQGYPNLEYIVIDGGSTDGTKEVIKEFASNLTYWQSQKDGGQYHAINQGFAKSTGEILCWLNADDMLLPRSLFVVGEIFAQLNEVDWISSLQPASWDANGNLAHVSTLPGFSQQAFLDGLYLPTTARRGYWLQQESTFWRRSLWEKIGSEIPSYPLAGDFALWCHFYEHAQLYGTPYPLGGFRMLEGQRSEDYKGYMSEASAALENFRTKHHWRLQTKNHVIYSSLTKLPYIGKVLNNYLGYESRVIQNSNMRTANSSWEVVVKRFLP